ncbi:MAG TPA: flagella basal body P-ring formation protein FlgA [Aeromicrobium sp.]|nr:flagella basal body P-ring formation protein FlgA [Aeromicrobium sp.]
MDQAIRKILIHRRLIAAILVGLSVATAISAITKTPDTRAVFVAARDLAGGKPVGQRDLVSRQLPVDAIPAGALKAEDLTGRVLAGSMRRGEVFTDRRVVNPRNLGRGQVLAVAEVPNATGELLRPGDRIDLVAVGDDGGGRSVAAAVELVSIRVEPDRGSAVLGVATTEKLAAQIAQLSITHRLNATVSRSQ